ncbi:MAG: hypothetical protein JJU36_08090 [Phycisphaeraceae bacterium]|nr:hypothetical protein [Phycisphaeraceae bacterium]
MAIGRLMAIIGGNIAAILAMILVWALLDWLHIHADLRSGTNDILDFMFLPVTLGFFMVINLLLAGQGSRTRRLCIAVPVGAVAWVIYLAVLVVVAVPIHFAMGGSL